MSNSSQYRVSLTKSEFCEIFFYNSPELKGLVREDAITGERYPVDSFFDDNGEFQTLAFVEGLFDLSTDPDQPFEMIDQYFNQTLQA